MGNSAYLTAVKKYSEEINREQLIKIYKDAMQLKKDL